MRNVIFVLLSVAFIVALSTRKLLAAPPSLTETVQVFTDAQSVATTRFTSPNPNLPATLSNSHSFTFSAAGAVSDSASITASIGELKFNENASFISPTPGAETGIQVGAGATVADLSSDELTLSSSSLAVGTLVPVHFEIYLTGMITEYGYMSANVADTLTLNTAPAQSLTLDDSIAGIWTDANPLKVEATFQVPIGETFVLSNTFNSGVGLDLPGDGLYQDYYAPNPRIAAGATVDFSNTLDLYADPLIAGVTLEAQSGHDYSSPPSGIPETGSTAAMLALALLGIAVARHYSGHYRTPALC